MTEHEGTHWEERRAYEAQRWLDAVELSQNRLRGYTFDAPSDADAADVVLIAAGYPLAP